jgi:hypothetical protein
MIKMRLKHESLGLKAPTPGLFLPKPSVLGYRPVMLGFFLPLFLMQIYEKQIDPIGFMTWIIMSTS